SLAGARLRSSLRGARGWWPRGHGAGSRAGGGINQTRRPPAGGGASKTSDHALPASGPAHAASRVAGGQVADLAITHCVEDPGEQLACHGDLGDVLSLVAAAGEDVLLVLAQRVAGGHVLDRLDQRPPHGRGPLLGDVPAADLGIGFPVPGVSPAHEHSRAGVANRVMSPISATITAASTGPIPAKSTSETIGPPRTRCRRQVSSFWPHDQSRSQGQPPKRASSPDASTV